MVSSQKEKKERKKSETEIEVDGTKELHVTLSPRTPGGDPPETEELIKSLMVSTILIDKNIFKNWYCFSMLIKNIFSQYYSSFSLKIPSLIHEKMYNSIT